MATSILYLSRGPILRAGVVEVVGVGAAVVEVEVVVAASPRLTNLAVNKCPGQRLLMSMDTKTKRTVTLTISSK